MNLQNSILDRIISSKKFSEIENFNPAEVVSHLFKNLTSREEDILRRRYGLLGKEEETLEKIGESYRVTRERVRQIENTAIQKIKKIKNFDEICSPIENTVFSVLEQHGGIMPEDLLLNELLQSIGNTPLNRQNITFIIGELLKHKFKSIKAEPDLHRAWQILHAPLHLMKETIHELIAIVEAHGKPMSSQEITDQLKKTPFFQKNQSQLSDEAIASYLEVSTRIAKNPFAEYGLANWGSIVPKRMNDKIYLILKRHNKPLHFTEIATRINEANFDSRKAYPPTVHNELILNRHYVLVGRGIYALKEWGYKPGVVSSVLEEILRKENRPLRRDELVSKVLEQRIVKKNTIHLALTDKTKFIKHQDGTYSLLNAV